ncbi:MAG: helix-turn-helix domain-containing protein [Haloplanus sp.]
MPRNDGDGVTRHLSTDALETEIASATNPGVVRRLCFVRNLYQGDDLGAAAERVGVSPSVGREWRERWAENGVDALRSDAPSMRNVCADSLRRGWYQWLFGLGKWKTVALYCLIAGLAIYASTGPTPPLSAVPDGDTDAQGPRNVIVVNASEGVLREPRGMTLRGVNNSTVRNARRSTIRNARRSTIRNVRRSTIRDAHEITIRNVHNVSASTPGNRSNGTVERLTVRADGTVTVRSDGNATVRSNGTATVQSDGRAVIDSNGTVSIPSAREAGVDRADRQTVETAANVSFQGQPFVFTQFVHEAVRVSWFVYVWALIGALAFLISRPIKEQNWNPSQIKREAYHVPAALLVAAIISLLTNSDSEVFVATAAALAGFSTNTALARLRSAADQTLEATGNDDQD